MKSTASQTRDSETSPSQRIGMFFHDERLKASLSGEEVALYLGVSTETLSAYESGQKRIPMVHICALSNCLNIEPEMVLKLIKHRK